MLDYFLEAIYKSAQQRSTRNEMAEGLKNLPIDELRKLASGEVKLSGYDDDNWICKFEGTPFYDEALALETQCLELDTKQQEMDLEDSQRRREESRASNEVWDAKDAIRLKKRLLELALRKAELGERRGESLVEETEPELEEGELEDEEKSAAAYFVNKRRHEVLAKFAAELTTGAREEIKTKNFAVSAKKSDTGEPKYPIHDPAHARNALVRVRQFGSPSEKSKVYSAVAKKYPALATRSEVVPPQQQRKAEKKLGLEKGEESQKVEAPKQKVSHAVASMRLGAALAKMAALSPADAYGLTEEELMEAAAGGAKDMKGMRAAALSGMKDMRGDLEEAASYAKAHPIKHRLPLAVGLGIPAGVGGAMIGHAVRPGLGTAIGGLGGAALGGVGGYALTPSPEEKAQLAQNYAEAAAQMGRSATLRAGLRRAMLEHAILGDAGKSGALTALRSEIGPKTASVNTLQVADLWGRQMAFNEYGAMQKEALGIAGTALQGLRGAGRFLQAAGKGVYGAGKAGGVQGAKGALGRVTGLGGQMAGQFAMQNPQAAALLAGGALGAAGLGGAALGRTTA